jgi:hypothetical protein
VQKFRGKKKRGLAKERERKEKEGERKKNNQGKANSKHRAHRVRCAPESTGFKRVESSIFRPLDLPVCALGNELLAVEATRVLVRNNLVAARRTLQTKKKTNETESRRIRQCERILCRVAPPVSVWSIFALLCFPFLLLLSALCACAQ